MNKTSIHVLTNFKIGLRWFLIIAILIELLIFPSLANLYGCIMTVISFIVFSHFLQEKYIRFFPFAFLMYLSMFMYRYLPLIGTLIEGKPISYGFERPFETFLYEIILFLISSSAFYLACQNLSKKLENNTIQETLYKLHFFEITPAIIWGLGIIGLMIRIYNFSAGGVEYGDVTGKFLAGLDYLMYAPLCLFYPSLLHLKYTHLKSILVYTGIIFIINIASNSRESIISPIAIMAILTFLYVVLNNIKIYNYLSPFKTICFGVTLWFIISLLSNVSLAMLHTRKVRAKVDKLELFEQTVNTLQNESLMNRIKSVKFKKKDKNSTKYNEGWTEDYLDNFMMARYANLRITDETLYYAEKKGYSNPLMRELFKTNLLSLFPTPVLRFLNIHIDKSKMEFSRGDFLYGSGFGGYRITSHIGDGLATFGFWYFPIQFIVFFIIFKLLNSFVFFGEKGLQYAPFALMNVFIFLGMFRNANGITRDFSYIIRGYLEGIFTYLIIFHIVRLAINLISANSSNKRELGYKKN